jgi:hypothetical protein
MAQPGALGLTGERTGRHDQGDQGEPGVPGELGGVGRVLEWRPSPRSSTRSQLSSSSLRSFSTTVPSSCSMT